MTESAHADLLRRLTNKRAEVANYERILAAYRGRWYDMGRRHLADLKAELNALEAQAAQDLGPAIPA